MNTLLLSLLLFSNKVLATQHTVTCTDERGASMLIQVSESRLLVTLDNGLNTQVSMDARGNAGWLKYETFTGTIEDCKHLGVNHQAFVQKQVLEGKPGLVFFKQTEGPACIDFYNSFYSCK